MGTLKVCTLLHELVWADFVDKLVAVHLDLRHGMGRIGVHQSADSLWLVVVLGLEGMDLLATHLAHSIPLHVSDRCTLVQVIVAVIRVLILEAIQISQMTSLSVIRIYK